MGILSGSFWTYCRYFSQVDYAGKRWRRIYRDRYFGIIGAVVGGWISTLFGLARSMGLISAASW